MRNYLSEPLQSLSGTWTRTLALGSALFFTGSDALWAQTPTPTPLDPEAEIDLDELDPSVGERELKQSERRIEDQVITTMVETRLMSDPDIDALRLQVQTDQGNVTLRGQIPDDAHAERAKALAHKVNGVRSVDVKQGQPPPEAR